MKLQLIGSGGHAKVLRDICEQFGFEIVPESENKVLAFGALHPEALEERYRQVDENFSWPCLIHHAAVIANASHIGEGTHILANAVINSNAHIGKFCIINTGAIIEHDAYIGNGCHISPGAIVLGGAKVGDFCMIGANAVVVQGTTVSDRTFIKSGAVCKNK